MTLLGNRYIWKYHGSSPWYIHVPVTLIFIFILSLLALPAQAAKNNRAYIIYQQTQGFSQQLIEQLEKDISRKGYPVSKMLIDDINKPLSQANLLTLRKQQLLITIGSRVTEFILKADIDKPILSALIPRHIANSLRKKYSKNKNWSCLLIDQPINRQLNLITAILGKHINTGVLLGPFTKQLKAELIKSSSPSTNHINIKEVNSAKALTYSVNELSRKNDVLLTLPDPVIYNKSTIRGILLSAYRKKLPIIGFSKAYVKAGAIAAIYSKPAQISKQLSSITGDFFNHHAFKKSRYFPDDFSVAINRSIARSLGIKLDSDKLIIEKIKMAEKH